MADPKTLEQMIKGFGFKPISAVEKERCVYKSNSNTLVVFCKSYGKNYCEKNCDYAMKLNSSKE